MTLRIDFPKLKQAVSVYDLVQGELGHPNGSGKWLCPWHEEKTPSFHVNTSTNRWRCYGECGVGGDAVAWIQRQKGLGAVEAAKYLGARPEEMPPDYNPKIDKAKQAAQREDKFQRRKSEALVKMSKMQADVAEWAMRPEALEYFACEGIPESAVCLYGLGYRRKMTIKLDGELVKHPAYTIPILNDNRQLVNCQFRLANPVPKGAGKYRQVYGIPAAAFDTEPGVAMDKEVILAEGAKKGIVAYINTGRRVLAMPSKTFPEHMIAPLKDCKAVYIVLDPDAYTDQKPRRPSSAWRAAQLVNDLCGPGVARLVRLPVKLDDFFHIHGGDARKFESYLEEARRA